MNEPIPELEPLVDNLKGLPIGDFLKSRDFKRFCIQAVIHDYWRSVYNHVKDNRYGFTVGLDYEAWDLEDTLTVVLNDLYKRYREKFFIFIEGLLFHYSKWTESEIDFSGIVEDLELLNVPSKTLQNVKSFDSKNRIAVPKSIVPKIIDSADKLELCINKMDESIRNSEFNLTLTYAYSSLEGIFKAYISAKIPSEKDIDELSKVSKIVKEHLKKHFQENEETFPEPMLNLISTITNAVSNARNNFSESHFGNDSDRRLAEFTRDCTNSVGRLILKFLE